jgi:hypothetical protein
MDWDHIGSVVREHYEATGHWVPYDDIMAGKGEAVSPPTPEPERIDWDAIAAVVTQHFNETGHWVPYDDIMATRPEAGGNADEGCHVDPAPAPDPSPVGPVEPDPGPVDQPEPETPSEGTPIGPVDPVPAPGVDPAPAPEEPVVVEPGATNDLPAVHEVWHESFDDGAGALSRTWGDVDASVPGQLTLTSSDDFLQDAGAMVPPVGAEAGNGYGLYSFTLSMDGDAPGPYALLWPATDQWPGPELDLVEVGFDGTPYGTVHWDDNGGNGYTAREFDVDVTQPHEYQLLWSEGWLEGFVDGQSVWATDNNVPSDFEHGGENLAMGVGMQTFWSIDAQTGANHITVYDASYSELI